MTCYAAVPRITGAGLPHTAVGPRRGYGSAARRSHARLVVPRASQKPGEGEGDMEVPEDTFNGQTPEGKAASALTNLFTMAATRVILDQFTGSRHRSPVFNKLVDYLQENPLRDGNQWLAGLMRHEETDMRLTAVRILETRKIFANQEFDWEAMEESARKGICEDNTEIERAILTESLSLESFGEEEEEEEEGPGVVTEEVVQEKEL